MDFTCAGSRRKRKNAVDIYANHEILETSRRGRGRPSKGGQALRAKRYYIKNHMLVLRKRKLKRYMNKVKKIAADAAYNAGPIMSQLAKKCIEYTKRYHPNIKMNRLLHVLNSEREDQHLEFLNKEGLKLLSEFNDEQIGLEKDKLELRNGLAKSHSVLQHILCTLLSAHLLVRHVRAMHINSNVDMREELVKRDCIAFYEFTYSHLLPSEEQESQNVDRILADQDALDKSIADQENDGSEKPIVDQGNNDPEKPISNRKNMREVSTLKQEQAPKVSIESKPTPIRTDTVKQVKKRRKLKTTPLNEVADVKKEYPTSRLQIRT